MLLFTSLYFSHLSCSNLLFHSSLLLSHWSRISAVTQGSFFCRWSPRIWLVISVTAVEDRNRRVHVCIFIIYSGERCKRPACHCLEGFQHFGIFQLFEVKLESCVFWLDDSFQTKVEGRHQQVVVISGAFSLKTSCFCNVHSWSKTLPR